MTAAFSYAFGAVSQLATQPQGDIPVDLSGVPTDELRAQMTSDNPADRVSAARAAIKHFKVRGSGYRLRYDADLDYAGTAEPFGQITLGPLAYRSWGFLGSTLGHEIEVHWEMQFKPSGPYSTEQNLYLREVQAFRYSVSNATRFGNSSPEIGYYTRYRETYYNALTSGNRKLADEGFYESR